jgi:hypothetical protein
VAGLHHLNLIEPIVIAVLATTNPLPPPPKRWRDGVIPDINNYLKEPTLFYSIIYPNDHEFIKGEVLRGLLSLERKAYLNEWVDGNQLPKLNIPKSIEKGCSYTPWCIAQKIRDEYLRVYSYYYPELELVKNRGYLKAPQIAKLVSYKLLPPFIIHDRIRNITKGI